MKNDIENWVLDILYPIYIQWSRQLDHRRNRFKACEEVFTKIYEEKQWGHKRSNYNSGDGSRNEEIVSPYISMVKSKANIEKFVGLTFVDLGCGDFYVGKQLVNLCSKYIGIDIVAPLIRYNQNYYSNENVKFDHLDIVEEALPAGDVCFIRQVFQHLSNQQILKILPKLTQYHWVFITEHYPTDNAAIQPNMDKVQGGDIRVYDNSGVYLTEPPFNISVQALEKVLEVSGSDLGPGMDRGVIRTFMYKPGANQESGEKRR